MDFGFPTYSHAARQGDRGINAVSRIVSDTFGWLFKRNHQEHDFGIDGHIEIVSDGGIVTGQMLALQIKYGTSYTKEKNKWGYIYRGELKHFNYLASYPLPVLIIVCDPISNESYWILFRPEQTQRTKMGWHLTIPFENKLSNAKVELLALVEPTVDALADLEEYWATNNLIVESSRVFFGIDRIEVQALDLSRVAAFFAQLCSTRELAFKCQGKIDITFSGYDDDARELFEIPEVRKYVSLLDLSVPNLLFFATTDGPQSSLRALAFCLTNIQWESDRSTKDVSRKVIIETKGITQFLERQFPGLNQMTDWLGMSEEENMNITYAAARCAGLSLEIDQENK